jgi:hypothetical protein
MHKNQHALKNISVTLPVQGLHTIEKSIINQPFTLQLFLESQGAITAGMIKLGLPPNMIT